MTDLKTHIIKFLENGMSDVQSKVKDAHTDVVEFRYKHKKYKIDLKYKMGYITIRTNNSKIRTILVRTAIAEFFADMSAFQKILDDYEQSRKIKLEQIKNRKCILQNKIMREAIARSRAKVSLYETFNEASGSFLRLGVPRKDYSLSLCNGTIEYIYDECPIPRFEDPNLDIEKVISVIVEIINLHKQLRQESENCISKTMQLLKSLSPTE